LSPAYAAIATASESLDDNQTAWLGAGREGCCNKIPKCQGTVANSKRSATDEVCGNYTLLKRESAAPKYQGIIIVVHYNSEARSSAHDDSLSVFLIKHNSYAVQV
jgi:hypothetical protein